MLSLQAWPPSRAFADWHAGLYWLRARAVKAALRALGEPAYEEDRMGREMQKVCLVVMALCLGLAGVAWAAPSTAELAPPTLAVQNAAGDAGQSLVGVVRDTLAAGAEAMPEMRASVASPWALEARIAGASAKGEKPQVRLLAELTPPAGGLRYMAEATGEGATPAEAAGDAARQAMHDLGVCVNAKGAVYHYGDDRLEAWVTIGQDAGLRPHAKVAFLRNGVQVGEGRVITVKDADSIVRVDRKTPAGSVTSGVEVRVLENGPRRAVAAEVAHKNREQTAGAFLAGALLWGLIAAAR